jgi:hypothetical protein
LLLWLSFKLENWNHPSVTAFIRKKQEIVLFLLNSLI